jgi:hypothetical protein
MGKNKEGEKAGHDQDHSPLSDPITVSIVHALPTDPDEKKYYRDSTNFQRRNFIVGLITLFVLFAYTAINYCLYGTTKAQLEANAIQFLASQRPYVVLGDPWGTLAEVQEIKDKPFIALHFVNTGNSTASHFAVQTIIWVPNGTPVVEHAWGHRQRWIDSDYAMSTTSMGPTVNLGAKAEYTEYLPVGNNTREQLTTAFAGQDWEGTMVDGQMEYCDIFGQYRCENFNLVYKPSIGKFIPAISNTGVACTNPNPTDIDNAALETRLGRHQIPPCEQPNEPDYQGENWRRFQADVAAKARPSASATPLR